jgi:hypothetical protein
MMYCTSRDMPRITCKNSNIRIRMRDNFIYYLRIILLCFILLCIVSQKINSNNRARINMTTNRNFTIPSITNPIQFLWD